MERAAEQAGSSLKMKKPRRVQDARALESNANTSKELNVMSKLSIAARKTNTVSLPPVRAAWNASPGAARTVDELSFTSRDELGRFNWWDVTPPKTNYWHVHEMLGRAYAFELLDLIHNPNRVDEVPTNAFGAVAAEIVRQGHKMNDGLYIGFFAVFSEYLIEGRAAR